MSTNPACIVCEQTQDQTPLIPLQYQGGELFICAQHLPVLIHKPEQLSDKLPKASLSPAPVDHSDQGTHNEH